MQDDKNDVLGTINKKQGKLVNKQNGHVERRNKLTHETSTHHATHAQKITHKKRLDSKTLWSTSYTLNILRRINGHDSLPFCL